MKMFITGSYGFIGQNLYEKYKNNFDIFRYEKHSNIDDDLNIFHPNIIINAAAEIYNPELMYESNVVLLQKQLRWASEHKIERMICVGSSSEYGIRSTPHKETDCPMPVDMYSATKAAGTMLCLGYAKTYKLPVCVARPYSVYGKYEKQHRLFPRLINAFKNNDPMTLYDGNHDFIYIDDFIKGIDILLNADQDKIIGDIVNFGSGIQTSNNEVLDIFKKITGNQNPPISLVKKMRKAFESDLWVCDTTYAKEKYNFETTIDLNSGISFLIRNE
jgi:nucleoside-diphosphate-sugar epimerase